MTTSQRPGWGRITAAIAVGTLLGGPVFAVAHALGLGALAAAVVAAAVLGGAAVALAHRLPPRFDADARRHPIIALAWLLVVLAGAGNLARVSVYMADPGRADLSLLPADDFYRDHNCLTAYVRAAELSRSRVDNLYDPIHYWGDPEADDDPRATMGGFPIDLYEYPPPFLLPARAAIAVADDWRTPWRSSPCSPSSAGATRGAAACWRSWCWRRCFPPSCWSSCWCAAGFARSPGRRASASP